MLEISLNFYSNTKNNNSIYAKLKKEIGREPTQQELTNKVKEILFGGKK